MSDTFSIRLPAEQTQFLDKMAKETDRSRNKIISGAIARMMDNYAYVEKLVEEADADIAAGRVVSNEEAMRRTQAVIDRAVTRKAHNSVSSCMDGAWIAGI